MRGLRASEWAKRSCSLWLVGQVAVLGGMALPAIAEDDPKELTEMVKQEREQQLTSIEDLFVKAEALAEAKKYPDAEAAYQQVIARLENIPGELAKRRLTSAKEAFADFKASWSNALLEDARKAFSSGDYKSAQSIAQDASLVDPRCTGKVDTFLDECLKAQNAAEYRKATDSVEAFDPGFNSQEEQIDLLIREAKVFMDAKKFDDARERLEKVFLIDPYQPEAARMLQQIYDQLYHYATGRRKADIESMMAYMNWQGVEPVFPTVPRESDKVDDGGVKTLTGSGVMGRMEKIIFPRIELDKQNIFTVVNLLMRYSQQYDSSGEGVQIIPLITRQEGDQLPKITMVFNRIPMSDVLRYVCQATGLKFRIDNGVVVIGKKSNVDEMQTESFPVRRDVISRLSEGTVDTTAGGLYPNSPIRAKLPTGADALPFGGNVPGFNAIGGAGGGNNAGGFSGNTDTSVGAFGEETGMGGMGMGGGAMGPNRGGMGGAMGPAQNRGNMGGGFNAPPAMMRQPGVGKSNSSRSSSSSRSGSSSRSSSGGMGMGGSRSGVGLGGGMMNAISTGAMGGAGGAADSQVATSFDPSQVQFAQRMAPVTSEVLKKYFTERGINFDKGATVAYDPRSNKLQVKNTVENLRKMDNLLRQLNVEVPMVMVEARIVEVTETNMDQLGFDWVLDVPSGSNDQSWSINSTADRNGNDNPLRYGDQFRVVNDLKIFPNFGESIFGSDETVNLGLSINAISQNKTSEVLTSPKILTASDTWASLEMTESRYYPSDWEYEDEDDEDSSDSSSNSWGNNGQIILKAPTPVFDDGGTELGVNFAIRPIIGPDNYTITLDLYLKIVSYIGQWNYNYEDRVYSITTDSNGDVKATLINSLSTDIWMPIYGERTVTVKIKIYDGETIVLGGMIDSRTTAYDDKWPLLGDIPLVGRLFQSKIDNQEKTNLLVFVTTRLINNDGIPLRRDRGNRGVPDFNR